MFLIIICFQNRFKSLKNNNADEIVLSKINTKSIGNQFKCFMNSGVFNKYRVSVTETYS